MKLLRAWYSNLLLLLLRVISRAHEVIQADRRGTRARAERALCGEVGCTAPSCQPGALDAWEAQQREDVARFIRGEQ